MTYYVVKFAGPFGFIKPWTAVRDTLTFSQQFLTASTLEGIEKKLFPELLSTKGISKIVRYKLTYSSISIQQEVTQTRGWEIKKTLGIMTRNRSILDRGIMVDPILLLAFHDMHDACIAATQHLCLCRNEDVMLPDPEVISMQAEAFEALDGFELQFGEGEDAFFTGVHRLDPTHLMYGRLVVTGNPVKGG